ncbi:MAG: PAS domain S-box protein, partial [Acidobacteria bacterium]|nr:PAS domain S-box protein [Acidobacteriota bacterium]
AFRELQARGYIRYEDMPLQTKAGKQWNVEFISNVYLEDGNQVIQCNIRDITERKRAEEALRASEERYRIVTETATEAIITIDENSTLLFVNPSAEKIFGYSSAEMIGESLSMLMPEYLRHAHKVGINRYLETGRKHVSWEGVELPGLHKNGQEIPLEVSFSEVIKRGHRYFTGIARDITERKRAEEALKASEALQRQLSGRQSAILDALPAHICLLCGLGNILEVNASWKQFAFMNNFAGSQAGVGSNYIEVCENATGDCTLGAKGTAEGIKSVLSGKLDHFELEYPCHSPEEQRWFRLTVTPLQEDASTGVVVMHVNVTERKLSEEALSRAEAKYRSIVESLPAIVYLAQPFPPYSPIYVSPNITEFGYSEAEWFNRPDMWVSLLHEEDRERVLSATEAGMHQGLETEIEYRIVGRDGTIHWIHDSGRFVSDEQGNRITWQGVMVVITKTKELEEQLRQSQKLESIGRLSGGIAHDFNNMLTAINGYSDLTLRRLGAGDPLRHNIEEIMKAGERSAALTRQLLAFSRQQLLQPVVLYLNGIITETMKMLQRLIGEDIELITVLNPDAAPVEVDPSQLTQVIMNLAVNARDAMPQGGKLTIETANVFLDPNYVSQHVGVLPGAYVMLSVSDNGTGMSAKTQQHIFEPFFTTKEVGKGTGLGLATVYGIVKQSGGNIGVYSEEGVGTTFKIYLPRVVGQAKKSQTKDSLDDFPRGTETILLVEDEEMVRSLTRQILEECGYTVLEAQNGVEAISLCEKQDCQIDLLMTDVVMPQMGGRELAERFALAFPQMKILFTSGYTDDAVVRHGVINEGTNFIQKPFTPDRLAHKVREVLDAPHGK